ncbi:uncharacterized protein LTR77_007553 [Saxophila tyrrhenica]|uniref:Arrestin-like N-terminal domain-containing protein n=1 Tax=Saxophila tyrrhenica TaxID=1690608 RepID=A0AAV9P4D7_9PEZI|nr:hypothetical protein LTR77_007553 [Saxophila tyrrhenica]
MFSFKKKHQSVAEIHLTAQDGGVITESGEIVHRSNEDIVGNAVFKLRQGERFTHSKVLLRGIVTTTTETSPSGSLQPRWRTEKLPLLAVAVQSKAQPDFRAENGIINIPFRFNLDECKRSSDVQDLPPSVDWKQDTKWWSSLKQSDGAAQYSIDYSITASACCESKLIASTTRKLSVLPVAEEQPPPYDPNSLSRPGEYFTVSSPRPSKARRRTAGHQFQVAAQEPSPLRLDVSGHTLQTSVAIPLVIKLTPQDNGDLDEKSIPAQCSLKAQLVTRTFITPNHSRTIPTMERIAADEDARVRTMRNNEQSFTFSLSGWQQYGEGTAQRTSTQRAFLTNTGTSEHFAITRLPFLFNIDSPTRLSPTFFTPLLSRQHAIELKFTFLQSSRTLELSLPLQAVHEAGPVDVSMRKQFLQTETK